jgi:ATP-dependent DNA helicase RecQ
MPVENPDLTHLWNQTRSEFQRLWGYADFRPPQGEIVRSLLGQRDTLIVLPTGAGKSICFQLPAVLQTGLTLVISPLVALMENQVEELQQRQLAAAQFHSECSAQQRRQTLRAIEQQRLRLLYLSPESLFHLEIWQRLCHPDLKINGLIIDEAHCLVHWGETFRPAYRRLGAVRPALLKSKPPGSKMAIAAFTATADLPTQQVIQTVLQLQQPQTFRLSPYRPNLDLQVQIIWTPKGRRQTLHQLIQAQAHSTGLVYTRTRRDSEALAAWLQAQGFRTTAYHAGLSPQERRQIETAWLKGTISFVICTCAFGMGINKSDVRWVCHFHPPLTLSEYVQEMGRAGRDGQRSRVLMLVSEPTGWLDPEDQQRRRFFTDQLRSQQQAAAQLAEKLPVQGEINRVTRQFKEGAVALALLHSTGRLIWRDPFHYVIRQSSVTQPLTQLNTLAIQQMVDYIRIKGCRWQFLLQAFGSTAEAESFQCGHCNNCRKR